MGKDFHANVSVCSTCLLSRQFPLGRRLCTRDGRNVIDHAVADYCADEAAPVFGGPRPPDWAAMPLPDPDAPAARPRPRPKPYVPPPLAEWPFKLRVYARFRRPGDAGVGDTMARLFNVLPVYKGLGAGDAFKLAAAKLGFDCGCGDRQAALNRRYPYPGGPTPA